MVMLSKSKCHRFHYLKREAPIPDRYFFSVYPKQYLTEVLKPSLIYFPINLFIYFLSEYLMNSNSYFMPVYIVYILYCCYFLFPQSINLEEMK